MSDILQQEVVSLPVIETVSGKVQTELTQDDLMSLLGGFILSETVKEQPAESIHGLHTSEASTLLVKAGWTDTVRTVHEGTIDRTHGTLSHVDGLMRAYYQANTHMRHSKAEASQFTLEAYTLSRDEHTLLQSICRALRRPDGGMLILANPLITSPRQKRRTICDVLSGHAPETVVVATIKANETICFNNGYDASETSLPGTLWLHHVVPVLGKSKNAERRSALSRLEAN